VAEVSQGSGTGIFNPASTDNDNIGTIIQSGDGNTSSITQGGESGLASNDQDGVGNGSTILQAGGGFFGVGNETSVVQKGNSNQSLVDQSGGVDLELFPAGNLAEVSQDGNNNGSTITQGALGGHTASVSQTGDMLTSGIDQSGLFNTATVEQEMSNQNSTITQSGGGLITPLFNTADVSQVATAGNNSTITQSGIFNNSVVMQ
jgi:hypothetical protein